MRFWKLNFKYHYLQVLNDINYRGRMELPAEDEEPDEHVFNVFKNLLNHF
jgi:hypothetical protein